MEYRGYWIAIWSDGAGIWNRITCVHIAPDLEAAKRWIDRRLDGLPLAVTRQDDG